MLCGVVFCCLDFVVKTWKRGPIGCDENIAAMIFGSHSRNCLEF